MEALKEAAKEAGRLIVMAIIPVILMGINLQARTVEIDWFLVQFTAVVTLLRFVDSLLHEMGKERGSKLMEGGLTRF